MATKPVKGLWVEIGAKIDKLQKGMDGATGALLKAERNISSSVKRINNIMNAALVVGGVLAVKKLGDALTNLAKKGEELGSIEEGFKRLGGTVASIDAAKKATIGLVSSFDLMKAANNGLMAGIPEFNKNFDKVAELGARIANTMGGSTTEAIDKVTEALKSGKVAALQNVGIFVDAEKIYGKFADSLTPLEKKLLLAKAGVSGLDDAISRLAPVTGSAANAQEAAIVSLTELYGRAAIAVNSNKELEQSWDRVRVALEKVDFQRLAANAADFFATILNAVASSLPAILEWTERVTKAFNVIFSDSLKSGAEAYATELQEVFEKLEVAKTRASLSGSQADQKAADDLAATYNRMLKDYEMLNKEIAKSEDLTKKVTTTAISTSDANQRAYLERLQQQQKAALEKTLADKLAKEEKVAQKAAEKVEEELRRAYDDSVNFWEETFLNAINGNSQSLDSMLKELLAGFAASLAASVSEGLGDGLKSGASGIGQLLGQLASSSGSSSGGFFDSILNSFGMGTSTDAAHAAGIQGPGLANGSFGGGGGASLAAGATAAISTITAAFAAGKTDKANKDNSGTGAAVGGGLGAIGGSFFGPAGTIIGQQLGSMLGSLVGGMFKWGPQNPQTIARHAFANFIEDGFKKLSTVAFFDAKNKLQILDSKTLNFVEGDSGRFNSPDWVKGMDSWGDKAKQTFLGLGEALKEVQGITEDVGGQIGFLLGENLSGNIDNARLLVYQLGLSFEDMEKALVSAGLSGEMTWHEVEVALQGVSNAFEPGIAAVGDLAGAVDELMGSGGRGAAAIKSIKDIAVEAMQAGAKSLADLPRVMAEDGVAQETIDAIMKAIEQRGIKTLEELSKVSDRVGGGIVADIQSSSSAMAKTWEDMAKNIEGVTEELSKIPAKIESNVLIKVNTTFGDGARETIEAINSGGDSISLNTQAFANGGIISSRSRFGRGIAGEAGAEAILPLKTMPNGRLGVSGVGGNSGGTTLVINAQGASPGVEHMIRAEIEAMGNEAVSKSIQAIQDMAGRGGRYADF